MNKFFNWFGSKIRFIKKEVSASFQSFFSSSSMRTNRNRTTAELQAAYRGWGYACIDIKAEKVSAIELKLFKLDNNENLIGAVKIIKFDWYLGGIKHLTVKSSQREKGYGTQLLNDAEKFASEKKIRVLQATVRKGDVSSINCFKKSGFEKVNCFLNKRTNRNILIFQKILESC